MSHPLRTGVCYGAPPPRPRLPPSEKTPLPRQVQATPARAGAEGPGRLPPAGLAASRAPVLSPSGHRQCPPWGPPGPSLLAPPRRACRPCSGHSGSQGRVGTGARESSAWAPSGTERPLPDDSHSRPRRHKGPPRYPADPVVLGEKPITPRPQTGSPVCPLTAACSRGAGSGAQARRGRGLSRPAVGLTQAARAVAAAGAPLSPITLRPAVHVPRVSGTPLHPGTLVSVALPRWAQPLQLQPGRPAPPIFRHLSRGSLAAVAAALPSHAPVRGPGDSGGGCAWLSSRGCGTPAP